MIRSFGLPDSGATPDAATVNESGIDPPCGIVAACDVVTVRFDGASTTCTESPVSGRSPRFESVIVLVSGVPGTTLTR